MPAPIEVELLPHSPQWAVDAEQEALRLREALSGNLAAVHHIGSTAVPGIHAKPILDLLPACRSLFALDEVEPRLKRLGYRGWGEYGIAGRRYFTRDDPATGKRQVQLHCFEVESPEIERHLAFRDYLRDHPARAREYDREKQRCRDLHPNDSHAYTDAKADWIAAHLPAALTYFRDRAPERD